MDFKNFYYSSDLPENKITKNNTIPCHSKENSIMVSNAG